jgi:hypothetical protein
MTAKPTPGSEPRAAELYRLDREPESTADRVRRLQHEARLLAREEVEGLQAKLADAAEMAKVIFEGGEAYPAGVRELCERIHAEIDGRLQTLQAITARTFHE